jgi:hypothetical protein
MDLLSISNLVLLYFYSIDSTLLYSETRKTGPRTKKIMSRPNHDELELVLLVVSETIAYGRRDNHEH